MECKECHSDKNRATPLLGAKGCLEEHLQYFCGTCGICICMNKNTKGLQRWNYLFKSLGVAKLYLRTAEYINKKCLKICEMENLKVRKFYKMFVNNTDLGTYLQKNKD